MPAEWLHRSAFSWGGLRERKPHISQVPQNMIFGTGECNSVMTRYEKAWQRMVEKEARNKNKGTLTANIDRDKHRVDFGITYEDTAHEERSLAVLKMTAEQKKKMPHWMCHALEYNLSMDAPVGALNTSTFSTVFYPWTRGFFTKFELKLDDVILEKVYREHAKVVVPPGETFAVPLRTGTDDRGRKDRYRKNMADKDSRGKDKSGDDSGHESSDYMQKPDGRGRRVVRDKKPAEATPQGRTQTKAHDKIKGQRGGWKPRKADKSDDSAMKDEESGREEDGDVVEKKFRREKSGMAAKSVRLEAFTRDDHADVQAQQDAARFGQFAAMWLPVRGLGNLGISRGARLGEGKMLHGGRTAVEDKAPEMSHGEGKVAGPLEGPEPMEDAGAFGIKRASISGKGEESGNEDGGDNDNDEHDTTDADSEDRGHAAKDDLLGQKVDHDLAPTQTQPDIQAVWDQLFAPGPTVVDGFSLQNAHVVMGGGRARRHPQQSGGLEVHSLTTAACRRPWPSRERGRPRRRLSRSRL
jgi:hypothetical protein